MQKFLFKLAPLLKYRRHQRDLCRQLLAIVMDEDRVLLEQQEATEAQRNTQLQEFRQFLGAGTVDIDRSAARRYHAVQLSGDIRGVAAQRGLVAQQMASCRERLLQADQKVKALEKLEATQYAEYLQLQERREARELEESWLATHIIKVAG